MLNITPREVSLGARDTLPYTDEGGVAYTEASNSLAEHLCAPVLLACVNCPHLDRPGLTRKAETGVVSLQMHIPLKYRYTTYVQY